LIDHIYQACRPLRHPAAQPASLRCPLPRRRRRPSRNGRARP